MKRPPSGASVVRAWIAERDPGHKFTVPELAKQTGEKYDAVSAALSKLHSQGLVKHIGRRTYQTTAESVDAPKRVKTYSKPPDNVTRARKPGTRRRPTQYDAPGDYTGVSVPENEGSLAAGRAAGIYPPAPNYAPPEPRRPRPLSERLLDLAVEVAALERLDPKYVTELDLRRELKRRAGDESVEPNVKERAG